jgi:ESCRT-II complex subunit VPS22
MCSSIGVDPLASNKGFWSDLLGVGDFYYELGVQIIQIAVETRASNGGLMSLNEMNILLRQRGKSRREVSTDDILRAVQKLTVLGNGFKIIEV